MTIADIARELVELCRARKFLEAVDTLYATDVVSVEPFSHGPEMPATVHGIDAVRAKNEAWAGSAELHNLTVDGPFVGEGGFAVRFTMDVTPKATGKRVAATEMALYSVEGGKIAREEFYYAASD